MSVRPDDDDLRLPVVVGPVSNGEFIPAAASPGDADLARAALETATEAADALFMKRRRFLQTAGGMAAFLASVNLAACGESRRAAVSSSSSSSSSSATTKPGGTYRTPEPTDLPACESALGSQGEFIFDVHTHHVMPSLPWRSQAPATLQLALDMVPPDCMAADPLTCVDQAAYLHDVFVSSDTTVALLTDLPSTGESNDPLPFADAESTRRLVSNMSRGGAPRLLLQNVVAPNFGPLSARLEAMTQAEESGIVSTFKVYTAWGPGGVGFELDDPAIGLPVVQHAHDLGVKVFCAHKGLPLLNFSSTWNQPRDMVAVSRQFPDMQFVVYHSAWTPQHVEGPYNPADPVGVDSLLKALDDYKVPPNSNVWADLATTWRGLLSDPTQAAHVLGKLLKRLGEDRVLWGTDSVWYGPPQTQIMAFRAFEISAAFQEAFGYPALSSTVKNKVLGLNAATLFGLDPHATRCVLTSDTLQQRRGSQLSMLASGEIEMPSAPRGPVTRRQILSWLAHQDGPWVPT